MTSTSHLDLRDNEFDFQDSVFVASRINNPKSSNLNVMKEVDALFENADNYLNTDSNIIIGRIPCGPKINNERKIIPYSIVGKDYYIYDNLSSRLAKKHMEKYTSTKIVPLATNSVTTDEIDRSNYSPIQNFTRRFSKSNIKGNRNTILNTQNPFKLTNQNPSKCFQSSKTQFNRYATLSSTSLVADINLPIISYNVTGLNQKLKGNTDAVDLVSDLELKQMFETRRMVIKKNNVNSFMINLPKDINEDLKRQEKHLNKISIAETDTDRISEKIAHKINKPKSELLINRTDSYRAKKEIQELIISNKHELALSEKMLDLRKPKDFKGVHTSYVNYGTCDHPHWHTVRQSYPEKAVEIIRKSNVQTLQDLNNMTRGSTLYTTTFESSKISVNDLEEIKEIHVEGKNLLEAEYENSLLLTGRKYLYQKPKERAYNDQVIETLKQNYKYKFKKTKIKRQELQQLQRNSMKFH